MDIIPGMRASSSALTAERIRMEVTAQNIANALTRRGPDGKPYERQQVVFQSVLDKHSRGSGSSPRTGAPTQNLVVARIEKDPRPPRLVPDPAHPGLLVAEPVISIHEEMVDYIAASRAYEANLAMVRSARTLAIQTMNIGKR